MNIKVQPFFLTQLLFKYIFFFNIGMLNALKKQFYPVKSFSVWRQQTIQIKLMKMQHYDTETYVVFFECSYLCFQRLTYDSFSFCRFTLTNFTNCDRDAITFPLNCVFFYLVAIRLYSLFIYLLSAYPPFVSIYISKSIC